MISKMPSPDILLKNQLIFIDPALKICTQDGKRLMITRVITSLIKNKNLLKIYLFKFNIRKRHYFPVPLIREINLTNSPRIMFT